MKHGCILLAILLIAASATGQTIMFNPDLVTGGTPANLAETVIVVVENTGGTTVTLSQIVGVKTTFPGTDWLAVEPTSLTVPAFSTTQTISIILNKNAVFNGLGTGYRLEGYIFALTDLPDPEDSLILPIIEYDIGGGMGGSYKVDTLATACLKLAVSETGEMGQLGSGGVNLDYLGQSIDCDPAARVYLYSGGPLLVRQTGPSDYSFHTGLYQTEQFATSRAFVVLTPGSADTFSTTTYDAFTTGILATSDTAVGIRRTYYAPTDASAHTGPCDGMVVRTDVFSLTGSDVSHLLLAEISDWDVPSDVDLVNSGGVDSALPGTFQQGVESNGLGCQPDSARFAAQVFLAWHTSGAPCTSSRDFHGGIVEVTDSLLAYDTADQSVEGGYHWKATQPAGLRLLTGNQSDLFSMLTYKHDFSVSSTDTLVFFSALTTVENGNIYELRSNAAELYTWYEQNLLPEFCGPCAGCCVATVGNIDCSANDAPDVGDLTALLDNLFISFTPLCCVEEANCSGDPENRIDVGDITALVDNLYINFTPLPTCCGQ